MNASARWVPGALVLSAAAAMLLHGPIGQPESYHDFADRRPLLGLPNAADVLSNVGFALAGLWGFRVLRTSESRARLRRAAPGYLLFVAALLLTALGSAWYHLAPDNGTLLWDRLPIALACAGLLGGARAQTVAPNQSAMATYVLAIAAVASVLWWSMTEARGAGDLRPYLLVQGAPLVLIPIWQAIARAPRAERIAFGVAILLYLAAKAAELADRQVLEMTGSLSGHTLKHLLAGAASLVLVANIARIVRAR
ncbi:MAG TPA: hypothetical protein VLC53_04500 [Myxococcota bacterium]|nr:hypothetical protein [Myxococcota bacterium]